MAKKRIGVIRGGPSSEYSTSLQTGSTVLNALRGPLSDEHAPIDIFVDKAGVWHIDGIPVSPTDALSRVDAVFNALHGSYGNDGRIQNIFETHGAAFTGSDSFASSVGMNKALSKASFQRHGLKTPLAKRIAGSDIRVNADLVALELFRSFPMPAIIKPLAVGSPVGELVVATLTELSEALSQAAQYGDVLIEEYISGGVDASVGIIEDFRGQRLYALPPVEIRVPVSHEIIPSTFPAEIKTKLEEFARAAHTAIGARHYSRSDFIVHPRRGIYILEISTLPSLTEQSLVPRALAAVGSSVHEFVQHVLRLAQGI